MKLDFTAALKDFGKGMARQDPNASIAERFSGGFKGVKKYGNYKPKAAPEATEHVAETVTVDPETAKRRKSIFETINRSTEF